MASPAKPSLALECLAMVEHKSEVAYQYGAFVVSNMCLWCHVSICVVLLNRMFYMMYLDCIGNVLCGLFVCFKCAFV